MKTPTEIREQAEELANMLFYNGEAFDIGCNDYIDNQLIEHAKKLTNKPYCIVKEWCWWDIDMPESISKKMVEKSTLPAMLFSHYIIDDELKRFPVGGNVRSSLLYKFHPPAFFETGNTVYILTGRGTRKTVTAENVMAIM